MEDTCSEDEGNTNEDPQFWATKAEHIAGKLGQARVLAAEPGKYSETFKMLRKEIENQRTIIREKITAKKTITYKGICNRETGSFQGIST